jgi:hypothetical protein
MSCEAVPRNDCLSATPSEPAWSQLANRRRNGPNRVVGGREGDYSPLQSGVKIVTPLPPKARLLLAQIDKKGTKWSSFLS